MVSVTHRPPLPPGKTRYPLYRRLGGPQGWSGWVRKISLPPGFDSRTVQPVPSHYTDWAILAPNEARWMWKNRNPVLMSTLRHGGTTVIETPGHSCHRWPVGWVLTSLQISRSFCSLSVFHRWASARTSSSMWNVSCPTLLPFVTCPRPVLACARRSMFSSRSWDTVDVRSSTCNCNRAHCFLTPVLY